MAAATAILYLALQQILTWPEAVVLALIFAFATSAWSLVSRSLASHAPVVLLNSLLAYLLFRSFDRPRLIWLMVPVAVLSFYFRPTNVTSLAAIAVYVWVHARRQIPIAVLASLPIVAVFLAISLDIYGTVLTPYFYSTPVPAHLVVSFHPKVFEGSGGKPVVSGSRHAGLLSVLAAAVLAPGLADGFGPALPRAAAIFRGHCYHRVAAGLPPRLLVGRIRLWSALLVRYFALSADAHGSGGPLGFHQPDAQRRVCLPRTCRFVHSRPGSLFGCRPSMECCSGKCRSAAGSRLGLAWIPRFCGAYKSALLAPGSASRFYRASTGAC